MNENRPNTNLEIVKQGIKDLKRKKIESQVPLGRLGTVDEFAHFCMPYLVGKSTFATGQFVSFSGGWS